MEVTCRAVTGDLSRTKWLIHDERLVDENPHIRLSIATVELPDGTIFDQYVMRMRRAAMTVVLDEPRRHVLLVWRHHFGTLQRLASALSPDPDALISVFTKSASDPPQVKPPRRPAPRPRADRWWQQAMPFPAHRTEHRRYTAAMARELLAKTSEFPNTKGGMLILLTEYRHALHDVATELGSGTRPAPA